MPLDRAFLSLLSQTAKLERHTGKDEWGNDAYGTAEDIACFYADEAATDDGTANEGQGVTNPKESTSGELITDAISLRLGDRIVPPHLAGNPVRVKTDYRYATSVTTNYDESGVALYQTSTLSKKPAPTA